MLLGSKRVISRSFLLSCPAIAVCMPKRKKGQFLPRVDLAAADALVRTSRPPPLGDLAAADALVRTSRPPPVGGAPERKLTNAVQATGSPVSLRAGRSSRADVPVIKDHARASLSVALHAASEDQVFETAVDALDRDMFAATSAGPRQAVLATYSKLHRAANGADAPVLPLTADMVRKTAALFKAGGYKSYRNYISRLREDHIAAGHEVPAQLDQMIRLCKKSVIRGLAGALRSEAFPLEDVCAALTGRTEPLVSGGPVFPLALFVLATLFLLRELEAASATWSDIVLNDTAKTVTLTLPSSKTDWAAKGCRRTWGCTCHLAKPCAYHTASHYKRIATARGLLDGPLFVDKAGCGCSKAAIIDTLRAAIAMIGQPITDQTGKHLFSGHAFRITGARTLSVWGLDAITIQLLGRWGSLAVLSYIAEAPLSDLARRLTEGGLSALPEAVRPKDDHRLKLLVNYDDMLSDALVKIACLESELNTFKSVANRKLGDLEHIMDHHEAVLSGMADVLENVNRVEAWYVYNELSQAVHKALVTVSSDVKKWKTACGWPFAGLKHVTTFTYNEPIGPCFKRCHKCFSDDAISESSDAAET